MQPQQRLFILVVFAAVAVILIDGLACTLRCYQ
jgi:hypothetical protein